MLTLGRRGRYAASLKVVTAITLTIVLKAKAVEPGAGGGALGNCHGIVVICLSGQRPTVSGFRIAALGLIGVDSGCGGSAAGFVQIEQLSSSALLIWVARAFEAA